MTLAFAEDFIRFDHPPVSAYRTAQSAVTGMRWLEDHGIIEFKDQCFHLFLTKLENMSGDSLAEQEDSATLLRTTRANGGRE